MKFYIMWANHDALYTWDRRIFTKDYDTVIWQGKVNSEQFHTIGKRWIDKHFGLDEYYFIDNKPVVSIYDLQNFIDGLGGIENTANEMIWLENEAKKAGFDGVHFQFIKYGTIAANQSGVDSLIKAYKPAELMSVLPFSTLNIINMFILLI